MKCYLAGRFSRREELLTYSGDLIDYGFEVTSRWLSEPIGNSQESITEEQRCECADRDRADLFNADVCIVFLPGGRHGGLFWEMGAADAWSSKIILVGPRDSGPVFGYAKHIEHYEYWSQALLSLIKFCVSKAQI